MIAKTLAPFSGVKPFVIMETGRRCRAGSTPGRGRSGQAMHAVDRSARRARHAGDSCYLGMLTRRGYGPQGRGRRARPAPHRQVGQVGQVGQGARAARAGGVCFARRRKLPEGTQFLPDTRSYQFNTPRLCAIDDNWPSRSYRGFPPTYTRQVRHVLRRGWVTSPGGTWWNVATPAWAAMPMACPGEDAWVNAAPTGRRPRQPRMGWTVPTTTSTASYCGAPAKCRRRPASTSRAARVCARRRAASRRPGTSPIPSRRTARPATAGP